MRNQQNVDMLKGELVATFILWLGVALTFILIYNEFQKSTNQKPLFSNNTAYNLLLLDRIVFVIIFGYYLYVSYIVLEQSKQENENVDAASYRVLADTLNVLAGIIALYVVMKYPTFSISEAEEPVF